MEAAEIKKKFVVYSIPGVERAQVRANIVYKSVDNEDLLLDAYYPAGFAFDKSLPAVLFIHGDGPKEMVQDVKDDGQYISWGRLVAASGLVGLPFNHRSADQQLAGRVKVAEDVHDAITYVREKADELCVNKGRLCIWACSAGVPYLQEIFSAPPVFVRGMVAYYGSMDFQQYADTIEPDTPPEEREFILQILKKYSLIHYLQEHPAALPPLLVAKAGQDDPIRNESIDRFISTASSLGAQVEYACHDSGEHGFDVLNDDGISRSIIARTLSFMQKNLLD